MAGRALSARPPRPTTTSRDETRLHMRTPDVLQASSTPLRGPAFPPGPTASSTGSTSTSPTAPTRTRCAPWSPSRSRSSDPVVRFEVIRMPDSSGLGDYTESGQVLRVRHDGQHGRLHPLDVPRQRAPPSPSAARAAPTPRSSAGPAWYTDSDTLVGTLDYGSLRVATATMGFKHAPMDLEAARAEVAAPDVHAQAPPGLRRHGRASPSSSAPQITDLTVKGAWTGPGPAPAVRARARPARRPAGARGPRGASHILTDLTLPRAELVHDYLAA